MSLVEKAASSPLGFLKIPKLKTPDRKKFVRVVKLTGFLLVAAFLQVSAGTVNAQRLSISVKNSSLEKVFSEIEKHTPFVFFYDATLLQHTHLVTVEMKDASVEDILRESLKGQGLGYSIQDRTIFLKRDDEKSKGEVGLQRPQAGGGEATIIVQSEDGQPLGGATVVIRKLKITNLTNSQGVLKLKNVPDGEFEVEVTFTGFDGFKMMLRMSNGEGTARAGMKAANNNMDEAQVIAYGKTSKRLNTGDVTTVKGEDIAKQPVLDPVMALEGRVPGLYISQTSGMPGANYTIWLQGRNSIANGVNPLYIVDGVPFTSTSLTNPSVGGGAVGAPSSTPTPAQGPGLSPFNALNPADIESITVLKDADATAIYGSRGANGVILITTKKGKAGQKSRIDVSVFGGAGKVTRTYHLLNTPQYLAMRHEAFYNDSIANPSANIKPGSGDYDINGTWDTTRYTDWQKVLIGGVAHLSSAQASLSGGDANTQFVLSGGYSRQTTVFPGDYVDGKASVHTSINHSSVSQKFHALFTAQYVNDINVLPFTDPTPNITLAPDAPALFTSTGALNWQNGTWNNPKSIIYQKATATTNNLIGRMNVGYEIIRGLQITSSFGYTHIQLNQSNQSQALAFNGPPSPFFRVNQVATSNVNTWIIEPQIDYTKKIAQGKLDVLLGSTIQENVQNTQAVTGSGFLSDALVGNIGSAPTLTNSGSSSTDYRYNALFGRVNYSWMDKYLINATARRDGSSKFGQGKQFGNFGAIGGAWIFSNEGFFQTLLPVISFGKLRGSYGTTGNDQITDYQYLSAYTTSSSAYQGVTGLYPTQIANPYFAWEVVKKIEIGIQLGLLKDRIIFAATYYRNRTNNQLVGFGLPSQDGFTSIQANLPATVQNSGGEFELNTVNFKTKEFSWTTGINVTIPRNKLVAYKGLETSAYKNSFQVGKSLFIKKYYHNTGVDPQTGNYSFADFNHDGLINNLDQQFTKPISQSYYGGILNTISYKGLQIDMFFQFVKQIGTSYLSSLNYGGRFNTNMPNYILSRWHYAGQLTDIQRFTETSGPATIAYNNVISSDLILVDASFVRLKNLALSYTMPSQWARKLKLQTLRIYVQGQNLLTLTSYKGLDPETQGKTLPPIKMITAGVQISIQ